MSPRTVPRPESTLTPAVIRRCRDRWDAHVAGGKELPKSALSPLTKRLEDAPDEWARWRTDYGFSDALTATLWRGVDGSHDTNRAHMATLSASWHRQAETVASSPLLAAVAVNMLSVAIDNLATMSWKRTYVETLCALLEAIPPGAMPCYSAHQIMAFLRGAERKQLPGGFHAYYVDLIHALAAPIGRHLGLSGALMRTVCTDDLGVWPDGTEMERRARLTLLLDEAPAPRPEVNIAGKSPVDGDPYAATDWSFYRRHVDAFLRHALFADDAGDTHLRWAWPHRAWRPALILHGGAYVLEQTRFWEDPAHVAEALAALTEMGPAIAMLPSGVPRVHITHWLRRVAHKAALGPWARAALVVDAGREEMRAEIWHRVKDGLQSGTDPAMAPEDWLPWLQSSDGQERADAVLLAGAYNGRSAEPPRGASRSR